MITIQISIVSDGVLMSKQTIVVRPGVEFGHSFGLPPLGPLKDDEITMFGYRFIPDATFNKEKA